MRETNNKHGDGSITRRADGTYQASLMVDGVRKYFYSNSEKKVRIKLKEYQVDASRGIKGCRVRFGKYFENWLVTTKKRKLKPTSYDRLERTYNYYLRDELGRIPLEELSTQRCQEVINKAADRLSYSTVKKIYEALNACLSYAVAVGDLQRNPMKAVEMPREDAAANQTKEVMIPTVEEMRHLFEVAKETYGNGRPIYNQTYVDAFRLICETGLRIGELLALKWENVSLDKATAQIVSSVSEVINRERGNTEDNTKHLKRIVTDTKTKSGMRTIYLNTEATCILKGIRERTKNQGFDSEYVLCNSKGKPAVYHELQRTLASLCRKAGMKPFGLHTLRHYFASRCLAEGAEPLALSKYLGHSKPSITMNVYAHLMPKQNDVFKAVLERMESNTPI